jgi:hypothetical protein
MVYYRRTRQIPEKQLQHLISLWLPEGFKATFAAATAQNFFVWTFFAVAGFATSTH